MPFFYLHLCDSACYHEDEEGIDLADLDAARTAAIRGLRDALAREIQRGQLNISYIDIGDESGQRVDMVQFADAVKIMNKTAPPPAVSPNLTL